MGYLIAVGMKMPGYDRIMPEGAQFCPSYGGQPFLFFYFDDISQIEVHAVQEGKISVGLFKGGEHTFFLLYGSDGLAYGGWGDAIYATSKVPEEDRRLPPREPITTWPLTILLVERSTGIVRAMRWATVTPSFSTILETLMEDQIKVLGDYSDAKHASEIQAVYARYPTAKDMLGDALIVEPIGLKFHLAPEK